MSLPATLLKPQKISVKNMNSKIFRAKKENYSDH